jgi:hypothetical protein
VGVDLAATVAGPVPKAVVAGARGSAAVTVANVGVVGTKGPVTVRVYAAVDRRLEGGGVLLGEVKVREGLGSKGKRRVELPVVYPKGMAQGKYYLVATVQGTGGEAVVRNNVGASGSMVKVTAAVVRLTGVVTPPRAVVTRGKWEAVVAVRNEGNVGFGGRGQVKVYASGNSVFGDEDDVLIGGVGFGGVIGVGAMRVVNVVTRPGVAGRYYLFATVTGGDGVAAAARRGVRVRVG